MTTTKGRTTLATHHAANQKPLNRAMNHVGEEIQRDRRISSTPPAELSFIRLKEVLAICGKSRSSVYEAIQKGAFPAPVKLCGRSSAWVKSEVTQWMEACIRESRSN